MSGIPEHLPDQPIHPTEQKTEEIGLLKGMALAVLDVTDKSDPNVEALLVISAVALFALGALLNQMGAHPGILSPVGTIGLRVVETTAFATGIFFAATGILRHFLKAIDEGGWIAKLTSDTPYVSEAEEITFFAVYTDDSTPFDAIFYGQKSGKSLRDSTLIPQKTVFEIAGQEATLYGLYSNQNIEEGLKDALQKQQTNDIQAITQTLSKILSSTTCDVALKIGDRVLTYAYNSAMVITYAADIIAETSYATQKAENYFVYGETTQALILGGPSTLGYLKQTDFEEEFSKRDTTRNHMLRLQALARQRGANEISLIIINLGEPIAPPTLSPHQV